MLWFPLCCVSRDHLGYGYGFGTDDNGAPDAYISLLHLSPPGISLWRTDFGGLKRFSNAIYSKPFRIGEPLKISYLLRGIQLHCHCYASTNNFLSLSLPHPVQSCGCVCVRALASVEMSLSFVNPNLLTAYD